MKSTVKAYRLPYYLLAVLVLGSLAFSSACNHRKTIRIGTHKVTVNRHGIQKEFRLTTKDDVPILEYEGINTAGNTLQVSIAADKVTVNGQLLGFLRKGDDVLIGDDGVAVNSMDYGESQKYLRANSSSVSVRGQ